MIEIGRLAGAAGVESGHADEGAGEGAMFAAAGLVGDDAGIEDGADRQPFPADATAEAEFGSVNIRRKAHRPVDERNRYGKRKGQLAVRPVAETAHDSKHTA